MTAKIIQFVPKPNPNRETSQAGYPVTTEPLGAEFSKVLYNNLTELYARSETIPYGGQGIDGMTFTAPDKDSA